MAGMFTDIDLVRKGGDVMQAIWKAAIAVSTITFCSLLFSQLALADFPTAVDDKTFIHFKSPEGRPEKYSQSPEREDWEKLPSMNSPLSLIEWRLVVNPRSSDQYMDKRIVGTVKNSSEKEFSEVKIEFTVFDEKGNQIAIVFSNFYNLKPRGIWKFEIPVTSDVGKAELKGLYIPAKDLKEPQG
jgi:hypothetical protein